MIAEIYDKQGSLVCTRQDTLELVERNNMYYITLISSPFKFNRIELWHDPDTKVGLFQHETFHPGEGRYAIPKLKEPEAGDHLVNVKNVERLNNYSPRY